MNDSLLKLFEIEVGIAEAYNILCKKEIENDYGVNFTNTINKIKYLIYNRNLILKTFNNDEVESIDYDSIASYLNKVNEQVDVDSILTRINILLDNEDTSNSYDEENRQFKKSKHIVMSEYANIQLSFIDECLNYIGDYEKRKILSEYKYHIISTFGVFCEDTLVNACYKTPKSIYLTSYVEARLNNISSANIDKRKKEIVLSAIDDKYLDLFKLVLSLHPKDVFRYALYGSELVKASIIFRSDLIISDSDCFTSILNLLDVNKDNPWYDIFLKDKERHKTLTLGINKGK